MIYYLIFGIIFLITCFEQLGKQNKTRYKKSAIILKKQGIYLNSYKFLLVAVTLVLILFAGTRVSTGIDINTYMNSYNKVNTLSLKEIEPFFIVLGKIVPNFNVLIFIYAALSIWLMVAAIQEYTSSCFLALAVFYSQIFLQYDMGIMRQGLALSIAMYGMKFLTKDKIDKKFWIVLCMSFLVHYSSIVILAFLLLRKLKIDNKLIILISVLAVLVSALDPVSFLLEHIFSILPNIFLKYINFATSENATFVFSFSNLRRLFLLLLFCIYIPDKAKEENMSYNLLVNSFFLSTIIYYLFKSYTIISGRLGMYFACVEIVLFGMCLEREKRKTVKLFLLGFICVYCLYYINSITTFYNGSWMNELYQPYHSWLFGTWR